MTIENILTTKGAKITTITADASINDAICLMHKEKLGALLVPASDKNDIGLISERDILRALARGGASILQAPVMQYALKNTYHIERSASVEEAMEIMLESRVRHLLVMENTTLYGIVSIGDLVNYRIMQSEQEAEALKAYITTG